MITDIPVKLGKNEVLVDVDPVSGRTKVYCTIHSLNKAMWLMRREK